METRDELKRILEDIFERPFSYEEVDRIGLNIIDLVELIIQKNQEDLPTIDYEK